MSSSIVNGFWAKMVLRKSPPPRAFVTDGSLDSFHPFNPQDFRNGDIVEVSFTCMAIPVKSSKFKLFLSLGAVVLLYPGPYQEASVHILGAK